MRVLKTLALLAAALSLSGCYLVQNEKAFGERVHAYLVNHPEVIEEALTRLQQKQVAEAASLTRSKIGENRAALIADPRDFVAGNPKGTITVVEFFDYRCGYCKVAQPELEQLLAQNRDVRLVLKEFPILPDRDGRLGVSLRAARAALAAGAHGKYAAVHAALMAHKSLDDDAINAILTANGLNPATIKASGEADAITDHLTATHTLGTTIGVQGTPAFVIGETMIPGADIEALKAAIEDARRNANKGGPKAG
jgi:protein-disulfide isomerase